ILNVRGSMRRKNQNGTDYLIRVSTTGSNKSLGPRSEETEKIHNNFVARKTAAQLRFRDLTESLERQQRMNRALFVGRAPRMLIDILNRLYKEGLSEFFTVIGTHALYAYEARAGVLFGETEAMATQDIDFLLDVRKRISFVTKMRHAATSMLKLIQKVDPSFRLREDQKHTAVNSRGFEVDIIRREPKDGDPHPMRLTDDENDEFYVVPARNAGILLDGPPFSAIIVSASGHMARMNTISPLTFIQFKRWMAEQADRDTMKRSRDLLQANLVEELVSEYLPQLLTQKS
ncbi:MAG: nucleotidyltransferase domain-containing protein, partial [Trichlorobacter sp.]|uniref:GSU2403 family nucleotidyltransferase fold protein n=1 Tax=Trichlorobacter sp. TaxID=2911007 RepID=UPI0025649919